MTTKYATANFKRLVPFIDAVEATPKKHFRFESSGYMPLSIERLEYTFGGDPVYSMMHYYIQFGDLMRDPEMTFAVRRSSGEIIPLSFCQSAPPLYREVFQEGFHPFILQGLDDFLFLWSRNIINQGFDPSQAANAPKTSGEVL